MEPTSFTAAIQQLIPVWPQLMIVIIAVSTFVALIMNAHHKGRAETQDERMKARDEDIARLKGEIEALSSRAAYEANRVSQHELTNAEVFTPQAEATRASGDEITAIYLMSLCNDKTTLQARAAVAVYMGTILEVSGVVSDVHDVRPDRAIVSLRFAEADEIMYHYSLRLHFNLPSPVAAFTVGHPVRAKGQIVEVDKFDVVLKECELLP